MFLSDDERQVINDWKQRTVNSEEASRIGQQIWECFGTKEALRAIELCQSAIKLDPDEPTYWSYYAYSMFLFSIENKTGIDEKALVFANRAVMLNDSYYYARQVRGLILLKMGRLPEALFEWSASLQLNSNNEYLKGLVQKTLSRVFVSYSFAAKDKNLAETLTGLLRLKEFTVVAGDEFQVGSVPQKVRQRIGQSFFLIAILTFRQQFLDKNYSTSSWLVAEAATARTLNRQVVLMVEKGISKDNYSCVLEDEEYVAFSRRNFSNQAIKLVEGLDYWRKKTYSEILQGKYNIA